MAEKKAMYQLTVMQEDDKLNKNINLSDKNVIGYFSVNERNVYCANHSQLKYVFCNLLKSEESHVRFDLNRNIDFTIKKVESCNTWEKLNNMFIWLSLNSVRIFPLKDALFLTFRGNLTKIMSSPYLDKDDWTICARLWNGVIYLNSFDTENDVKRKMSTNAFTTRCEAWGFKFEQYVLTDNPAIKPDSKEILNENREFACVFDQQISNHRIIYGAEMDGAISDKVLDLKTDDLSEVQFVECKTSRLIENSRHDMTFRKYKILKWWCQSYLSGVETIICGFRDDVGIVRNLKTYKVSELPNLAKGLWDKNVCLNFCVRFLDFVKHIIMENQSTKKNESEFWRFDFSPKNRVCATKVVNGVSIYSSGFKEICYIP